MPLSVRILLAALILFLLSVPAWAQMPIGGQVVSGGSGGTCSGDLSGTYPNCAVVNLSNMTNASLANSGLVNDSVTLNSHVLALGGSLSLAFSDLTGTLTAAQMLALPNGDIYAGNGSNQPVATALGAGVLTALGNATGGTGGLVTFSGALGTPSSGTGAHLTGIPFTTGITGGASTGVGLFASGTPSIGTVPNSDLTNSATTVNGQTCTLGSTCTVTAAPSGSAGGDLGGTYPNPPVENLSNVTNASLPNSGLANDSVTLNSHVLALGGSLTLGFSDFTGQIVAGQMMGLTNGSFYVGNGSNQPAVQAPGAGVLTAFELGVNTSGGLCTIGGSSSNCQMHVATLAQLRGLTTAIVPNGVWRDDYAAGRGASPLWFEPETGTCAANSRVNDGGSCVNTTSGDGNSFYAVFPGSVYNILQFGAVGDGTTDDSTSIQNAETAASANGNLGAEVLWPVPSSGTVYCIKSGITVAGNYIRQQGGSEGVTASACGVDVNVFTLDGFHDRINDLSIFGPQVIAGAAPTGSALILGSQCIGCILDHVQASFGNIALEDDGAVDAQLINDTLPTYGYGAEGLLILNANLSNYRGQFDQSPPGAVPTPNSITIANWAAATHYAVSPATFYQNPVNHYLMQVTACAGSCTSGGSAPALANYFTNVIDNPGANQVTWQYFEPASYNQITIGAGGAFYDKGNSDFTSVAQYGVVQSGSSVPILELGPGDTFATEINAMVLVIAGNNAYINGGQMSDCLLAGCSYIAASTGSGSFGENLNVTNTTFTNGATNGIVLGAGSGFTISGNLFGGMTCPISISANISNGSITNNFLGTSAQYGGNTNGICFNAGSSDGWTIANNNFIGATPISNLSSITGTHNFVVAGSNPGYNPVGPQSISVTGSPFTYTQRFTPAMVCVTGGTVSSITVGGVSIGTTSGCSTVAANQSMIVTYSGTPTMEAFVQ